MRTTRQRLLQGKTSRGRRRHQGRAWPAPQRFSGTVGHEGGASHGRAGARPWPPPGRSDPASGRPEPTTLPDSRREHPRCAVCAQADCARIAQVIRALSDSTQNFCYARPPRDLRERALESVINTPAHPSVQATPGQPAAQTTGPAPGNLPARTGTGLTQARHRAAPCPHPPGQYHPAPSTSGMSGSWWL